MTNRDIHQNESDAVDTVRSTREILGNLSSFRRGSPYSQNAADGYMYWLEGGQKPVFKKYEDAIKACQPIRVLNWSKEPTLSQETVRQWVANHFNEDLLKRALVDTVVINEDVSAIYLPKDNEFGFRNNEYFPSNIWMERVCHELQMEIRERFLKTVFRGDSIATYHNDHPELKGVYFMPPVALYSTKYDPLKKQLLESNNPSAIGMPFFSNIPAEQREYLYHMGIIAHEIAHSIFAFILEKNATLIGEWLNIIRRTGNTSGYAETYEGTNKHAEENFSEAVRIAVTDSTFLHHEVIRFLRQHFSGLKLTGGDQE